MPLLTVEGLNKSFGTKAVSNLDFHVSMEIVGLIGPNGSGKTTTINLLTGHLRPDSGSIVLDELEIAGFFSLSGMPEELQELSDQRHFWNLQRSKNAWLEGFMAEKTRRT